MIISWVSVKGDLTNWNQWVITVWPDLGDVEDIKAVLLSVLLWHGLDKPVPGWVITLGNLFVKVVSGPLRVLETLLSSLIISEVLDALAGLVVVLYVVDITLVVYPSESVG